MGELLDLQPVGGVLFAEEEIEDLDELLEIRSASARIDLPVKEEINSQLALLEQQYPWISI